MEWLARKTQIAFDNKSSLWLVWWRAEWAKAKDNTMADDGNKVLRQICNIMKIASLWFIRAGFKHSFSLPQSEGTKYKFGANNFTKILFKKKIDPTAARKFQSGEVK
jgi:hypothetical protein